MSFTIWLQLWGAISYLLSKVLFTTSELGDVLIQGKRRRLAWLFFLIGVPAWVTIFGIERNWIAAAVELSSTPAMFLGLVSTQQTSAPAAPPRWLDRLAKMMVGVGLMLSLYDFGGLTSITQVLEIAIVICMVFGTYQMSKERLSGYLWFMVGNLCAGSLMGLQGYYVLTLQQALSFLVMCGGYYLKARRNN